MRWLIRLARRVRRRLGSVVSAIVNRGDDVECPCCRGTFRRFLPYGPFGRPDARCPSCGALDRLRLLWLYLERETDLYSREATVLHVAPEQALQRRLAGSSSITYVTGDIEIDRCDVQIDLCALGMRSDAVDVIICNHVLEHVSDDMQAMREMHRILKPGGWTILMAPVVPDLEHTLEDPSITSPADRLKHYGQEDHVRKYGMDYPDRLRACGFIVDAVHYADSLPPDERERYKVSREAVYHCHKAAT